MIVPPADDKKDPYREDHGLDEAKKKLSEIRGRPFDVDTILAQDRARKEREMEVRKKAENTLEEERGKARLRRHEIQAAQVVKENQAMLKKDMDFEEKNLQFAKKLEAERRLTLRKDKKESDEEKNGSKPRV